eukprot:TRINITY_DN4606_c1_g1_i4.p1 TRINITY_DN4606_c1_g1~~TRINITY_DN4606_c1_g1_i4.p1  ORF type:complete len:1561 (+),score=316.02 TRINITY_DN4606_c1_g1_i4:82-4683(+)
MADAAAPPGVVLSPPRQAALPPRRVSPAAPPAEAADCRGGAFLRSPPRPAAPVPVQLPPSSPASAAALSEELALRLARSEAALLELTAELQRLRPQIASQAAAPRPSPPPEQPTEQAADPAAPQGGARARPLSPPRPPQRPATACLDLPPHPTELPRPLPVHCGVTAPPLGAPLARARSPVRSAAGSVKRREQRTVSPQPPVVPATSVPFGAARESGGPAPPLPYPAWGSPPPRLRPAEAAVVPRTSAAAGRGAAPDAPRAAPPPQPVSASPQVGEELLLPVERPAQPPRRQRHQERASGLAKGPDSWGSAPRAASGSGGKWGRQRREAVLRAAARGAAQSSDTIDGEKAARAAAAYSFVAGSDVRSEMEALGRRLFALYDGKPGHVAGELALNLRCPPHADPGATLAVAAEAITAGHNDFAAGLGGRLCPAELLAARLYTMQPSDIDRALGWPGVPAPAMRSETPGGTAARSAYERRYNSWDWARERDGVPQRNGSLFGPVCRALRDQGSGAKEQSVLRRWSKWLWTVGALACSCKLPANTILWRGLGAGGLSAEAISRHRRLCADDLLAWPAPSSTSSDPEVAKNYMLGAAANSKGRPNADCPGTIMFRISGAQAGLSLRAWSQYPAEEETLLGPLSVFRVLSVEEDRSNPFGQGLLIALEALGPAGRSRRDWPLLRQFLATVRKDAALASAALARLCPSRETGWADGASESSGAEEEWAEAEGCPADCFAAGSSSSGACTDGGRSAIARAAAGLIAPGPSAPSAPPSPPLLTAPPRSRGRPEQHLALPLPARTPGQSEPPTPQSVLRRLPSPQHARRRLPPSPQRPPPPLPSPPPDPEDHALQATALTVTRPLAPPGEGPRRSPPPPPAVRGALAAPVAPARISPPPDRSPDMILMRRLSDLEDAVRVISNSAAAHARRDFGVARCATQGCAAACGTRGGGAALDAPPPDPAPPLREPAPGPAPALGPPQGAAGELEPPPQQAAVVPAAPATPARAAAPRRTERRSPALHQPEPVRPPELPPAPARAAVTAGPAPALEAAPAKPSALVPAPSAAPAPSAESPELEAPPAADPARPPAVAGAERRGLPAPPSPAAAEIAGAERRGLPAPPAPAPAEIAGRVRRQLRAPCASPAAPEATPALAPGERRPGLGAPPAAAAVAVSEAGRLERPSEAGRLEPAAPAAAVAAAPAAGSRGEHVRRPAAAIVGADAAAGAPSAAIAAAPAQRTPTRGSPPAQDSATRRIPSAAPARARSRSAAEIQSPPMGPTSPLSNSTEPPAAPLSPERVHEEGESDPPAAARPAVRPAAAPAPTPSPGGPRGAAAPAAPPPVPAPRSDGAPSAPPPAAPPAAAPAAPPAAAPAAPPAAAPAAPPAAAPAAPPAAPPAAAAGPDPSPPRSPTEGESSPAGSGVAGSQGARRRRARLRPEKMRELFSAMDRNKDGRLTRSEVIRGLGAAGELGESFAAVLGLEPVSPREGHTRDAFESVFQSIDQDEDRTISWPEFYEWTLREGVATVDSGSEDDCSPGAGGRGQR